jgi:hypothetical protein
MAVDLKKIEAAARKLIADPEMKAAISEAVTFAKELQAKKFSMPGVKAAGKETCGGCFSCLACAATPTPDLEAGCLLTAFYIGS